MPKKPPKDESALTVTLAQVREAMLAHGEEDPGSLLGDEDVAGVLERLHAVATKPSPSHPMTGAAFTELLRLRFEEHGPKPAPVATAIGWAREGAPVLRFSVRAVSATEVDVYMAFAGAHCAEDVEDGVRAHLAYFGLAPTNINSNIHHGWVLTIARLSRPGWLT